MRPPVVPPDWPPPIPTEPTPNRVMSFRRSEEHTSELQSQSNLVCRLLLEKKKKNNQNSLQRVAQSPPPATAPAIGMLASLDRPIMLPVTASRNTLPPRPPQS